ncbi:hypothetical protein [Metabacillus halosaccharovorans]|uniref:hypothetical protein n=1 Tax=Metabacillus halosaccharovorans TaxID=930124 RepID=UPI002041FA7F|nr:hypothetical protein [Metabacillus halosaccharovorans]MCM3439308.1 hypothetical protein [Metabacillus halosaccharovorans]
MMNSTILKIEIASYHVISLNKASNFPFPLSLSILSHTHQAHFLIPDQYVNMPHHLN